MSNRVRFIVPRPRNGGVETVAIVTATVRPGLTDTPAFLRALTMAVTNWAKHTRTGQEAWRRSSEDFNVGDLSSELDDLALRTNLNNHGIFHLEIDTFDSVQAWSSWTYDTMLVKK